MGKRIAVGRVLAVAVLVLAALGLAWVLFVALPRRYTPPRATGATPSSAAPAPPKEGPKIKVRLYYVADGGTTLRSVEREVAYGDGPAEQAKRILAAQLEHGPSLPLSAVPDGTRLRALFITNRGEAFVDLSSEFRTGHPGGSLNEILSVYTIVDALTTNLPVIKAVQILIDGQTVDTLAGHVDLRRPLTTDLAWVE